MQCHMTPPVNKGSKKKWKKVSHLNQKVFKGWGCGEFFLNFPTYQILNVGTQATATPFPEADIALETG